MKWLFILLLGCLVHPGGAQTIQLHYDLRHLIDPARTAKNFPTVYFEYFKTQDSGKAFVRPGSFLLKFQADFQGEKTNLGKYYMQVSQSFRCWQPKIFVNLQFSGGLGLTEPRQYSYYLVNTYSIGAAYPFRFYGAYLSAVLNYKFVPYVKPTHDPLFTLYWWKAGFGYRVEWLGDFSVWTENRNHGDEATKNAGGKQFSFFAEPQAWYNLNKTFSVGLKITINYHVLTTADIWQPYPSVAVRAKL